MIISFTKSLIESHYREKFAKELDKKANDLRAEFEKETVRIIENLEYDDPTNYQHFVGEQLPNDYLVTTIYEETPIDRQRVNKIVEDPIRLGILVYSTMAEIIRGDC